MPADRSTGEGSDIPSLTGEEPSRRDECCKVERVARAYHIAGIDPELRRRYEEDDATLHELANYINERITAVSMDTADVTLDVEPGTVRAALRDERSISATKRDDIRAHLAGSLDVERLVDSFVSHETVRRHLNEHLDVSTAQRSLETREELSEVLDSYQEQYRDGVAGALDRAVEKGLIEGHEFTVYRTQVECSNCSTTSRVAALVENGGCDCETEEYGENT